MSIYATTENFAHRMESMEGKKSGDKWTKKEVDRLWLSGVEVTWEALEKARNKFYRRPLSRH